MTSKEMTLTISLGRETYVTPNAMNLVRVLTDDQLSELIARWAEELPDTALEDAKEFKRFFAKKLTEAYEEYADAIADEKGKNMQTHESYGMLSFSRVQHGGNTHLFGSSIEHRDTIQMSLTRGRVSRQLNTDWYYGGDEIVRVEMSGNQFADLITSMNVGSGTPVTIRRLGGRSMEEPPYTSPAKVIYDEFVEELSAHSGEALELIAKAKALFEQKKAPTKKDKEDILDTLNQLSLYMSSNMPYQVKQFQNMMDKTTTAAKAEVEAFVTNRVLTLGQQALVKQAGNAPSLAQPEERNFNLIPDATSPEEESN